MNLLGEIAAIALIVAAVFIMFGSPAGKRLLTTTIVVVILLPVLLGLLKGLMGDLAEAVGGCQSPGHFLELLGGAFLLFALLAFTRFVNHYRRLRTWLGQRPTSLKRRVERE